MSSGDMGYFDESGLLFVDGRDDDMIVSGGQNVFPQEVENLLVERDDVFDAAVVGVDDSEFGSGCAPSLFLSRTQRRTLRRSRVTSRTTWRATRSPAMWCS
jgi:acyl-CoA synthetase (AMP-forming)/AMP-acid ligase II